MLANLITVAIYDHFDPFTHIFIDLLANQVVDL